jgi:hypothetical protein
MHTLKPRPHRQIQTPAHSLAHRIDHYHSLSGQQLSPLDREDARDAVHIRTVDDYDGVGTSLAPDWPAALCTPCHSAMVRIEFDTFLEYRFARNGRCPRCSARRTHLKVPRLLDDHDYQNLPPWQIAMGIGVTDTQWFCGQCHHEW